MAIDYIGRARVFKTNPQTGKPLEYFDIELKLDLSNVSYITEYVDSVNQEVVSGYTAVYAKGLSGLVVVVEDYAVFAALLPPAPLASTGLYGGSGTVPTSVNATVTDTLEWSGGRIIRDNNKETSIVNSTTIVEVSQASDLPATLVANTTYVIRGTITLTSPITITNSGCSMVGFDRNRDKLIWDGATGTTMLTVTDVDFDLENLCLSSNNTGSVLIAADNYNAGSYNDGRLKVFTIINCQFRNCFDIASFDGWDLVDIQNTLFWYCEAPNFGVKFTNTSKIEVSSCEFIRWFRESEIPTPLTYATCAMIELVNGTSNFGAVNINGSVIHPQQTQDGIKIDPASTTGFGLISSNVVVPNGLTTGVVTNFDYDVQNSYVIQANQTIPNGNAYATMSLTGNAVYLENSVTNPILLADASTVGGGGFTAPIAFPISQRVITTASTGNIEYNSKIDATFFVTISATVQMSGNGDITLRFVQNGVAIASSIGVAQIKSSVAETITFSILGIATQGDDFQVQVESSTAADVLISELSLNGYQL